MGDLKKMQERIWGVAYSSLKVMVGGKVDAVAEGVAEAAACDELWRGERGRHGLRAFVKSGLDLVTE